LIGNPKSSSSGKDVVSALTALAILPLGFSCCAVSVSFEVDVMLWLFVSDP
jgi:hypothetical protein